MLVIMLNLANGYRRVAKCQGGVVSHAFKHNY